MLSRLSINLLFVLFCCGSVYAETTEYSLEHWGVKDGLPQTSVNAIAQTEDGYLWIGTFNGLARFDGYRFSYFKSAEYGQIGLMTDRITFLRPRGNDLLVGGFRGAFNLVSATHPKSFDRLLKSADQVQCAVEAPDGSHFVQRRLSGLSRYTQGHWKTEAPSSAAGYTKPAKGLALDPQGAVLSAWGPDLWSWSEGEWSRRTTPAVERDNPITALVGGTERDQMFLVYPNAVYHFKDERWELFYGHPDLSLSQVTTVLSNGDEGVWVGTERSGLFLLERGEPPRQWQIQQGMPSNQVSQVLMDREGSVWVGSLSGGLTRLRPKAYTTWRPANLAGIVTSVLVDNGGVLFGTSRNGLYRIVDDNVSKVNFPYSGISSLYRDKHGRTWAGTDIGIAFFRDADDQEWEELRLPLSGKDRRIFAIFEDQSERFWFGTTEGAITFDGQQFTTFENGGRVAGPYIRTIAEDSKGNIWLGSQENGLTRFSDGDSLTFTTEQGMSSNTAWHLFIDSSDVVWSGSFGEGLSRIEGDQVTAFTIENGLADNVIGTIALDQQDRLWLGSAQGLFYITLDDVNAVIRKDNEKVNSSLLRNSIAEAAEEVTGGYQSTIALDAEGNFWLATSTGITRFNPGRAKSNPVAPLVALEEVKVNDVTVRPNDSSSFNLPPGVRRLSLHFTALSFINSENIPFRYRLDGFDESWVDAGQSRIATYTDLLPGKYNFQVTAANTDNVWNESGITIPVVIQPYFWETFAFRLGAIILLVLSGILIVLHFGRRRLKQEVAELERQQFLSIERLRIARDLHDSIGSGLTHLQLLSDGSNLQSPDANVLDSIHERSKSLARSMDEIVWSVDPRRDSLESLLSQIASYAEEFLRYSQIRFRVDLPVHVPHREVSAKIRHCVFSCAKEAINNAVKYADCGEIVYRAWLDDMNLHLTITDDGSGFKVEDALEANHGLDNLAARMADVGGTFELDSSPGKGTRITLVLEKEALC